MSRSAPASSDGPQLRWTVGAVVAVVGMGIASVLPVAGRDHGPTPSRAAADRPCPTTVTEQAPRLRGVRLRAQVVARAMEPTSLALDPSPGRRGDGVLGERAGRLVQVAAGEVTDRVVLDRRDDTLGDGDGGLLGVAYHPDEPWLYVYRATANRHDVVAAYPLDADRMPVASREREILRVDHPPSQQHHGGGFLFGGDGMLYIGLGDGGGLGDPRENAQDPTSLLGKVLRIEPTPWGAAPYRIPTDNPFVDRYGWRPEIWVLGVRNPYRLGLDEASGDLWLGDVGQSCWEELDRLRTGPGGAAGANLGWDRVEGTTPFEGGDVLGRELGPAHTYAHGTGACAVVAGHVVRGPALPGLDGWMLYSDFCRGRLRAVRADEADGPAEAVVVDLGVEIERPTAIVPGPRGRPWVLSLDGAVYELSSG